MAILGMRSLFRIGLFMTAATIAITGVQAQKKDSKYHSPYSVKFNFPVAELLGDLKGTPRGDTREESAVPFAEWYSPMVRKRYGSWGPPARQFPPPEGIARRPLEWKRERVIAIALRFQGYDYQHHHVPDWDPPADWPWKEVRSGHNGKGVDCSNFTSFVYNVGFGIKPTSTIKPQSEEMQMPGPGNSQTTVERIARPENYADFAKTLQTGDLLYVRNNQKEISHVVIWVGPIGQSPDGAPLIIDSHGEGVVDSNGASIPPGIQLRPFRDKSWYYREADHAFRVLRGE